MERLEHKRIEPRMDADFDCHLLLNGRRVRNVRIANISQSGLLVKGRGGLYLRINDGDHLAVYTQIDGVKLRLEGVVVRSTVEDTQAIALSGLKWFEDDDS